VLSEENGKIRKSFKQFGLTNTGASPKDFLIYSNEYLASEDHLISLYLLSMSVRSFTTSTKLEMNLLKKLIFPRND
jgi:hypothetical protein